MPNLGRQVLLIDDDEQLVALLDVVLTRAGYRVAVATRPQQGYDLACGNEHDVIILDAWPEWVCGLPEFTADGNIVPVTDFVWPN